MSKSKKKNDSENIRVVIRCRNLLQYEMERGDKAAVRMDLATQQVIIQHAIGDPETYAFDAVYNNTFTQRNIFLQEVQPLVEAVLQGYNATVFAYGQSGSGKTHTMTGNLSDPSLYGIMPQVVEYLFGEVRKLSTSTKTYKIKVSYIELYNGKARDLLVSKQETLEIALNMAKNFFVKGAQTPEVTNFEECVKHFNAGTVRRQTASTDLNDQSSRSHALFSLTVDQFDFEQDPSAPIAMSSKINIVDLAGSEKLSKTNATGETAKEGCNINLSLSALATVIDTIVKGGKHIPYRGSSLTMLLKDSLGGNSKTVMFANVGPSDKNLSESISTLRFALRAKQIENKPIKNMDPKDARIQDLLNKIEELQKRIGGTYDPSNEENMQKRIEELEVENDQLRGSQAKDTLELETMAKVQQGQIEQLTEIVKERDHVLLQALENRQILEANLRSESEASQELRNVAVNFVKRICTEEQLRLIRSKMPNDGVYNHADDGWDLREIQFYLEGFLDLYSAWRQSSFTDDDLNARLQRARIELEAAYTRQLADVCRERDELLRQHTADSVKRTAENESQSALKVEYALVKEENGKLRDKIERDQEKFKKKLDKMKEEAGAVKDELDATRARHAATNKDVEMLKKLLEESGARSVGGSGGASLGFSVSGASGSPRRANDDNATLLAQLETAKTERNKFESKLKETMTLMRRKGFCIKPNTGGLGILGEVAPQLQPGTDTQNEAFILAAADEEPVDGDLLGLLQQQIRVQHRLQELRHQHQRKLDDMIRKLELVKTGKVTPLTNDSTILEEVLKTKIGEALTAKEVELAKLKADHEATTDKLVKKINKKLTEFKESEAQMLEDKSALDEERTELKAQHEELQKFNQQLSVEVESLRGQLSNAKSEAEGSTRLKDSEIAHIKADSASLMATMEQYRTKATDLETLQQEFHRLQQQNHRTEASLKEKLSALDSTRQMNKVSQTRLENERKRVHDLEEQVKATDVQFREMEEHWRAQLIENANKLVSINNKKLEEQASQYQSLIGDEQEKQKLIREKLRKAKSATQKAAQRYDEMVLENETLQVQFEDLKVSAMKMFREKQEAQRDLESYGRPAANYPGRKF